MIYNNYVCVHKYTQTYMYMWLSVVIVFVSIVFMTLLGELLFKYLISIKYNYPKQVFNNEVICSTLLCPYFHSQIISPQGLERMPFGSNECFGAVVLKLQHASRSPRGLVKTQLLRSSLIQ